MALALACLSLPAVAQTPEPLANWQYSVGEVLAPLSGPVPKWRLVLGGGAELQPLYEGSKRYRVLPSIAFDLRYRDIAFLSDGEGLGVNLLRGKTYRAGVAFSYDLGRDHHIEHRLAGLGNVDPAPEGKLFAEYFVLPVVLTIDVRKAFGGNDGIIGDLGAYVPLPLADNLFVFTGPSVTLANHRYMQSYFGVSPAQAADSNFRAFQAKGGLDRAGWGVTAVYKFSRHWWLEGEGAFEYPLGAAGRSPIVADKSEFAVGTNLLYHF